MNTPLATGLAMLLVGTCAYAANAAKPGTYDSSNWNQPQQPFRIYGNTYYVGSKGLSSILITSPDGYILIDGTLPENAGMIEANIRALGFEPKAIKLILNSHAHADHAGAIAALAHDTGASVAASAKGVKAIMAGGDDPDDPQYGDAPRYPRVAKVRAVADNESVHIGPLAVQAHSTPGHTPGSTTWAWTSCEGERCLSMVYADSLSLLSVGGYRYADQKHPERLGAFRRALSMLAALPCDILMVPHQDAIDFVQRAEQRKSGSKHNPLINPLACKAYATVGQINLTKRVANEAAATPAHP